MIRCSSDSTAWNSVAMLALLTLLVFLALGTAQSQTPPNLASAMRGLDPITFSILYQPNPGIKKQIFDPKKTSFSSRTDFLNSFVSQQEVNKCVPEFSVERVRNYNEFIKVISLISFCDTEANGTSDVAAAWIHPEDQPSCCHKHNRKELDIQQFFQNIGGEILLVTVECTTHIVSISPFEKHFFRPDFQRATQILDFNSGHPNDESSERVFIEFVKLYGTHFSSLTHMGAKVVFLKRFPNRTQSTAETIIRRRCVLDSAYETMTPGERNYNETTLQHFSRISSEKCGGELEDVNIAIIGPLPRNSLEDWASEVKLDPQPIYFKLEKISKWFTDSWYQDPRYESVQSENVDGLNGTALYRYFQNKSSDYCRLFLGRVCQRSLIGCGYNSDCTPAQNCVDSPDTEMGYECVQTEYGGIIIVGGESPVSRRQCEAIGTNAPPDYPEVVSGNTLSLVGSTLYSCGGTSSSKVCRSLGMNDTMWSSTETLPWSISYHSAVTVADDIWFFTASKLYAYRPAGSNKKHVSYDTPFSSDLFTSCAVSNGSHTFVIGFTSNHNEIWVNTDSTRPIEWKKLANLHENRISHSCLWFGSEIFVSGGRAKVGDPSISSVIVINVESVAVRVIGSMNEARRGHQMAVLHGKPAVLGGRIEDILKSIETYDAQTDSWVTMNYTLQGERSYFGLVQFTV